MRLMSSAQVQYSSSLVTKTARYSWYWPEWTDSKSTTLDTHHLASLGQMRKNLTYYKLTKLTFKCTFYPLPLPHRNVPKPYVAIKVVSFSFVEL